MRELPVQVVANFGPGGVRPLSLLVNAAWVQVRRVNARWRGLAGEEPRWLFAVSAGDGHDYELVFTPRRLDWRLRLPGEEWDP
jgi:hypothetical protein